MPNTKYYLLSSTFIKLWILPLMISFGLFLIVKPIMAQQLEGGSGLSEYVKNNNVEVGTEDKNGYRQIFYVYNNNKVFITDSNYTNSEPETDKEFIVWQAQVDNGWRIFLFNIVTATTLELTKSGTSVNPSVHGRNVVWESQVDGVWQVFLFDGAVIRQLTQGDMSLNPDVEGDFVTYGRKDEAGWRASAYSIVEKKEADISTGENAKIPKLSGGKILVANERGRTVEFPLNVEDLFTLGFQPLVTVESERVTEEEILQEILNLQNATD